ncbi:MAG: hypothetical protein QM535_18420 [Limnohabitans sp.]|nr:hypothetical protein [Limnohabitans sp.]
MKKIIIIGLFLAAINHVTAQYMEKPAKKVFNPYMNLLQPGTIVVINDKIYDFNSKEARQLLTKLIPGDTTKSLTIIKDYRSNCSIKQILIIKEKKL